MDLMKWVLFVGFEKYILTMVKLPLKFYCGWFLGLDNAM